MPGIMRSLRRAKIIATMGPVSDSREMLLRLVQEGMDVARLNFSHGKHDNFARIIKDIRSIEAQVGRPIGIMADIQGPKIRVAKIEGGEIELANGSEIFVTVDPVIGGKQPDGRIVISVIYKDFVKDVAPGNTILLDDGLIAFRALERQGNYLRCEVTSGGLLKENKGINSPEANFSARAITDKDYGDILFALEQGVDFIALSFVRTAQEIRHLKTFIASRGKNVSVLAKIEMREALVKLDEIIDASDGILVARGDLAVEIGNERVPVVQKKIVHSCNLRGKPVIIATQMLMSMVDNPRPSRAEASDVANAVVDGADCLMLSNETTIGKYPLETVAMMAKIITEMENDSPYDPTPHNEWQFNAAGQMAISILQSAVRLAAVLRAKSIIVVTQSGRSAVLVSKCRPKNPVLAITGSLETYRQLSLAWGVQPIFMEDMEQLISQTAVFEAVGQRLLSLSLARTGDTIVITAGLPRLAHGSTNTIKVHQI